jgi:hypothetical protein
MKALIKFALAAVMLITTLTAQAGWVSGHYRSNGTYVAPYYRSDSGSVGHSCGSSSGYVYRNPYAAYPSVNVRGYYRSTGTYVAPHVRTAPNWTVRDNLSYRGYAPVGRPPAVARSNAQLDLPAPGPQPAPATGTGARSAHRAVEPI